MKDFVLGVRLFLRGFRTWSTSRRAMALGLIPGAITLVVFGAVLVAIFLEVHTWALALAQFATGDHTPPGLVTFVIGAAIIGGSLLIVIYAFTAITLLIGQPFFERVSDLVEQGLGDAPSSPEESWWRTTRRGLGEGARLLALTLVLGLTLFAVGLIPVVGAALAFICAAGVGGWFLALELTAYPLARRGVVTLSERRRLAGRRRMLTLGFGASCYLVCLVPTGAILTMPALVAGATHLARELADA